MKQNKITIVLNKPIEKVFEFTTNPQNTHLWVPSILEEIADEYPPKVDTRYRNRGKNNQWSEYKVVDFKQNELLVLSDLEGNYFAQYSYRKLDENKTEMEYFEHIATGELSEPFSKSIFENLENIM